MGKGGFLSLRKKKKKHFYHSCEYERCRIWKYVPFLSFLFHPLGAAVSFTLQISGLLILFCFCLFSSLFLSFLICKMECFSWRADKCDCIFMVRSIMMLYCDLWNQNYASIFGHRYRITTHPDNIHISAPQDTAFTPKSSLSTLWRSGFCKRSIQRHYINTCNIIHLLCV